MSDLVGFVEVDRAKFLDRHTQAVGDFFHIRFRYKHPLGTPKSPEGGDRDCVCLCESSSDVDVRDFVASIDVR